MMKQQLLIIFGVWAATCAASGDADQYNRQIKIGNETGNLTILLQNSEITRIDISPPEDNDTYVLLTLPSGVSVTLGGKIYEFNDANTWCFIMTLNKRCPLWHENIEETCPGGATALPIFGRTSVYLKIIAGLSQEGSNETTVGYRLIHRYQGFFNDKCTDLEPPTDTPTTVPTTVPDTTVPMTPPITTEAPHTEKKGLESTQEPPKSTTENLTGTDDENNSLSTGQITLIVIGAVSTVAICLVIIYFRRPLMNRCRQMPCCSSDLERAAVEKPAVLDSLDPLMSGNKDSSATVSPCGSHDTVSTQKETGGA